MAIRHSGSPPCSSVDPPAAGLNLFRDAKSVPEQYTLKTALRIGVSGVPVKQGLGRELEMSAADVEYYRNRARAERELAKLSSKEDVALIHREMAQLYDALIMHETLRPTLSIRLPAAA